MRKYLNGFIPCACEIFAGTRKVRRISRKHKQQFLCLYDTKSGDFLASWNCPVNRRFVVIPSDFGTKSSDVTAFTVRKMIIERLKEGV